jgi:hypothetical protein
MIDTESAVASLCLTCCRRRDREGVLSYLLAVGL